MPESRSASCTHRSSRRGHLKKKEFLGSLYQNVKNRTARPRCANQLLPQKQSKQAFATQPSVIMHGEYRGPEMFRLRNIRFT
jgi:hypothetical protein